MKTDAARNSRNDSPPALVTLYGSVLFRESFSTPLECGTSGSAERSVCHCVGK